MITKEFIDTLFDAASIRRWNDFVCPVHFTELDKQAHKMIFAWVLGRSEFGPPPLESDKFNWDRYIAGGIFEFLKRVLLTDLKPHIYHRMIAEKGREVNEFVIQEMQPVLQNINEDLADEFEKYLLDENYAVQEKRFLDAAHFLATKWEFDVIYHSNNHVRGIETTRDEIENQLEDHYDLKAVQKLALGRKTEQFISLCGQLRFQRRWAQSPRVPETSVLGHMLIVAILAYLCTTPISKTTKRRYNNFFVGLFHDLPEVLTRDIASPIKSAVSGLEEIIEQYEKNQMEERVYPLLPYSWQNELRYFTEKEFTNRVIVDNEIHHGISFEELQNKYDSECYSPVDGELLKACDHLSAFAEACISCYHGIRSRHLTEGIQRLAHKYDQQTIANIDFGSLFQDFRQIADV